MPKFPNNLKCAIGVLLFFITEFTPNSCQSKAQGHKCPFGWIWSAPSWSCIKLFLNRLTWDDARDKCKSNQGDLLVIQDEKMNNFVAEVVSDHQGYWIGLNDRKTEGVFKWLDNDEEAQYKNMLLGVWIDGDCVQLVKSLEGWTPDRCDRRKRFICELLKECPESRYGIGCSLNCSKNCGGPKNSCDSKNGTCTHGCKDGYIGEMCDTETNITQAVAEHQNTTESAVHLHNWTQSAAGGESFLNESALGKDNSTVSAKGESNDTLLLSEDVVSQEPEMLVAYLSALTFAAVVIGICMIPLCLSDDDDLESDPRLSHGYEPEEFGDCKGGRLSREDGNGYNCEGNSRSGDFRQEDFTTNDRSSVGDVFDYLQDEETHV